MLRFPTAWGTYHLVKISQEIPWDLDYQRIDDINEVFDYLEINCYNMVLLEITMV